ncbi:MAG: polysaccharide pyruvyl transferase family protein [Actinomycetota bacterium]|nr:polysaccharide pyruvyl transferase family protein [Actinomycetota bacterium]
MLVLVTGWFSFVHGEATAGDLMAAEAVCCWLDEAEVPYHAAFSPAFPDGVRLDEVSPDEYSHLLFVCGPAAGPQVDDLVARFPHARRIAVGVSVVDATPDAWHAVIERDSAHAHRPDLSLAVADQRLPPVVGLVQAHRQPEYADARHDDVHALIDRALSRRDVAVVRLGTRVDPRGMEAQHFRHVEAALARVDAVVTTRLHGLVLALRRGTPAVAVDPLAAGGKVSRQAASLGWPAALTAAELSEDSLLEHLDWCLTPAAGGAVTQAVTRGRELLPDVGDQLIAALVGT